jgi:DNA-binding response OmpR family regulator
MISRKPSILIVDDEQVVCDLLYGELSEQDYLCTAAFDGYEALEKLRTQDFEVVLLDIRLPSMSGMEVLTKVQSNHPDTVTIMITAVSDVDTVVEAMKLGALDYIVKPLDLDRVSASIRMALENKKCSPKRGDYKTALCAGGEQEDKQAIEESFRRMNAIACGVEARQELLTGHSKIVTQETTEIARQLGIPDRNIRRWAAIRSRHDSKRNAAIQSSIYKLERSPLAQKIIGIALPYLYTQKPDEYRN